MTNSRWNFVITLGITLGIIGGFILAVVLSWQLDKVTAAIKFETQRLPRLRLSPRDTAAILSNPDFEHLANEVLR